MLVDTGSEACRLRALLGDVMALAAIPTAWIGEEPPAVAAGLADAIVGLLRLDFAFVRLCDPGGAGTVEVTRGDAWKRFREWLDNHRATTVHFRKEIVPDVGSAPETCQGIAIPIGVNGQGGVLAAASERGDFPNETDQLLLSLAANQAATAFQSARLIQERQRAEEQLREARSELERKVAERTAELGRSEAYLAEAQRLTHNGSFAIDASTQEPTHSSDEHSRLYGFDPEDGIPSLSDFLRRIHPEDRGICAEALERGIREGKNFEVEYRVLLPPGPERRLRSNSHPVFNASGELEEVVGTVVDVTERRQAEADLGRLAGEQAALRRVATLVAQGASPTAVFDAVATEMEGLLDADGVALCRYEPDEEVVLLAHRGPNARRVPPGTRVRHEEKSAAAMVRRTGRPARMEHFERAGAIAELVEALGVRESVGAPIIVDGGLWGVIVATWNGEESPRADTEERMAQFAELLDTAIANADTRDKLTASRARLLTAGDQARRRVVRDLHDGAQQRLVHSIVTLKLAQRALRGLDGKAESLVGEALTQVEHGNAELRELAHGILPSALTRGGLRAGLDAVVARLDLPVEVAVPDERFSAEIEASAYFVVAEALTNVAKHSKADRAEVTAFRDDRILHIEVRDDGIGGANPHGHGLVGIADRVTAFGGAVKVESPAGGGTLLAVTLPLSID